MRINFVMSNAVSSGIFNAIIGYFKKYLPLEHELFVTEHPLDNMDIYHYHRPNLEIYLKENSIVTIHHDLEDTDPWFDSSQFIDNYHQANKIICLNQKQKDLLELNEDLRNTIVIPHGVNTDIFKQTNRHYPSSKLKIGIVSKRYGRRVKGEALLYELYKRLDTNKIEFYFIGENRTVDIYEAEQFGFEGHIFEKLPYNMFNTLYHKIDILLVPSLFEGGPANIPEAIYTKTPIIGRKIAMISDMIKENINGYFLTGNPDEDAILLNKLASNTNNIMYSLIDNINMYTPKVLTWKDVVDKHIDLYNNLLKDKNTQEVL